MHSAWLDNLQGAYGTITNAYIWAKVAKYNIQGLQFHPAQVTNSEYTYVRGKGLAFWLIRDEWKAFTPVSLAAQQSKDITDIGADGKQCGLSGNVESHDMEGYVVPWLRELIALRPGRKLVWTLEPHQGGLFTKDLIELIASHPNLIVAPEAFYGDMTPWGGTYQQLRDDITGASAGGTTDVRIPAAQVKVCYDGAVLSPIVAWDGVPFTFERIPAVGLTNRRQRLRESRHAPRYTPTWRRRLAEMA
jgi:hypothetical protein